MLASLYLNPAAGKASPFRPLAEADVRFVGDPAAIVLAAGRYIAEERDSARMLDACYSTLTTQAQHVSADAEQRLARIESLLEDLLASR